MAVGTDQIVGTVFEDLVDLQVDVGYGITGHALDEAVDRDIDAFVGLLDEAGTVIPEWFFTFFREGSGEDGFELVLADYRQEGYFTARLL